MQYLNKFLGKIKENPTILKTQNVILHLGLTSTQIKDLKKYALTADSPVQSETENAARMGASSAVNAVQASTLTRLPQ